MVSSNDLILFYLGLELQSLSLYILAAFDRNNLKSSESGLKYFFLYLVPLPQDYYCMDVHYFMDSPVQLILK